MGWSCGESEAPSDMSVSVVMETIGLHQGQRLFVARHSQCVAVRFSSSRRTSYMRMDIGYNRVWHTATNSCRPSYSSPI